MRYLIFALAIFCCGTPPVLAQHQNGSAEGTESGKIPEDWEVRFDHSSANKGDITFTEKDGGLHIIADASAAAIYYKPDMTASGPFRLQGTFAQLEKTHHPEAYGLIIGGKNLQKKNQQYLYFLVRQGGEFLIKRRNGTNTKTIADWSPSDALHAMVEAKEVTNQLKISRMKKNLNFWINGEKVKSIPTSQVEDIQGIVGIRINHHLNVKVNDFKLKK